MELWQIRNKVEELRAQAEKERLETDDFNFKNVLAAQEMAYEKIQHLFRQML